MVAILTLGSVFGPGPGWYRHSFVSTAELGLGDGPFQVCGSGGAVQWAEYSLFHLDPYRASRDLRPSGTVTNGG
jgi:hypothetical protein